MAHNIPVDFFERAYIQIDVRVTPRLQPTGGIHAAQVDAEAVAASLVVDGWNALVVPLCTCERCQGRRR